MKKDYGLQEICLKQRLDSDPSKRTPGPSEITSERANGRKKTAFIGLWSGSLKRQTVFVCTNKMGQEKARQSNRPTYFRGYPRAQL